MQSSRETSYFTPLLFTKKKDDQDQPSTSYTTPRPSRSPRSPSSAGLSSGVPRRRSLTPTGSAVLQPAEPPLASLYDDATGSGLIHDPSSLTLYNPSTHATPQVATLPDVGKECVVTVFGFQENHIPDILQEFSNCGDILRFFRESQSNWVHLQFGNKFEAQRALLKNGMILRNCVMVGVQTLAMQHKSFFDGSKDDEAAMKVPESKLEAPPLPTGKDLLLPIPSKRGWSKALELILGT